MKTEEFKLKFEIFLKPIGPIGYASFAKDIIISYTSQAGDALQDTKNDEYLHEQLDEFLLYVRRMRAHVNIQE